MVLFRFWFWFGSGVLYAHHDDSRYGSAPNGLFMSEEPRENKAAFRNKNEFEETRAPVFQFHDKPWAGHSMALVGKISVVERQKKQEYVVIKNSGGKKWTDTIDDCTVVHGFIVCARDAIFRDTRVENMRVLRSTAGASTFVIDEHVSPKPSLCFAILAANFSLTKKAFAYEPAAFGARYCDGWNAMDYADSLRNKSGYEEKRAALKEIADWLAEQEAARLVSWADKRADKNFSEWFPTSFTHHLHISYKLITHQIHAYNVYKVYSRYVRNTCQHSITARYVLGK